MKIAEESPSENIFTNSTESQSTNSEATSADSSIISTNESCVEQDFLVQSSDDESDVHTEIKSHELPKKTRIPQGLFDNSSTIDTTKPSEEEESSLSEADVVIKMTSSSKDDVSSLAPPRSSAKIQISIPSSPESLPTKDEMADVELTDINASAESVELSGTVEVKEIAPSTKEAESDEEFVEVEDDKVNSDDDDQQLVEKDDTEVEKSVNTRLVPI